MTSIARHISLVCLSTTTSLIVSYLKRYNGQLFWSIQGQTSVLLKDCYMHNPTRSAYPNRTAAFVGRDWKRTHRVHLRIQTFKTTTRAVLKHVSLFTDRHQIIYDIEMVQHRIPKRIHHNIFHHCFSAKESSWRCDEMHKK